MAETTARMPSSWTRRPAMGQTVNDVYHERTTPAPGQRPTTTPTPSGKHVAGTANLFDATLFDPRNDHDV